MRPAFPEIIDELKILYSKINPDTPPVYFDCELYTRLAKNINDINSVTRRLINVDMKNQIRLSMKLYIFLKI